MGLPAKRWLPPQWSKCRCVLTTMSMPARSKSCSLSGRRRGPRSATAGGRSALPVSTSTRACELARAWVDRHARVGMVDDVHVDRHPLALGEQVGNADWRDGDRGEGVHVYPPPTYTAHTALHAC